MQIMNLNTSDSLIIAKESRPRWGYRKEIRSPTLDFFIFIYLLICLLLSTKNFSHRISNLKPLVLKYTFSKSGTGEVQSRIHVLFESFYSSINTLTNHSRSRWAIASGRSTMITALMNCHKYCGGQKYLSVWCFSLPHPKSWMLQCACQIKLPKLKCREILRLKLSKWNGWKRN